MNPSQSQAMQPDRQARLRAIVDDHSRLVANTLRKSGVMGSELDDEVQLTFIVVSRRIDDVQEGAERSFVRQVAQNRAFHARRSYARRREVLTDTLPESMDSLGTPEEIASRNQMRTAIDAALAGLDESLRTAFVLHEIEEMNVNEVAAALGIPRGTVASRLRRARLHLRSDPAAIEVAGDLATKAADAMEGPERLRRKQGSRLQRALLRIGKKLQRAGSLRARTLEACRAMGLG